MWIGWLTSPGHHSLLHFDRDSWQTALRLLPKVPVVVEVNDDPYKLETVMVPCPVLSGEVCGVVDLMGWRAGL